MNKNWFNNKKSLNPWKDMIMMVIVSSVFVIILSYFMNGIYVTGVPKVTDISKVFVESNISPSYSKEFTDKESILLACNLRNYLNYDLGTGDQDSKPLITINYQQKDGKVITLSANETTLWYKGKSHPLKEEAAFVKLTEGVFRNK